MESMEFTYRLTEDDYLKAAKIKVKIKPSRRPWFQFMSRIYLGLFFFVIWFSMIFGRIFEWLEITGDRLGNLAMGKLLISSIVPASILSLLVFLLVRSVVFWPKRLQHREQYRRNSQCQVETTVNASTQRIVFRSETGSSESLWKCYAGWGTQDGILVLQTYGGVRQIMKVAELNQDQKSEFIRILNFVIDPGSNG